MDKPGVSEHSSKQRHQQQHIVADFGTAQKPAAFAEVCTKSDTADLGWPAVRHALTARDLFTAACWSLLRGDSGALLGCASARQGSAGIAKSAMRRLACWTFSAAGLIRSTAIHVQNLALQNLAELIPGLSHARQPRWQQVQARIKAGN